VLRDLASKPYLFHTPQARGLWESRARANLDRELEELGSR
jgi:predicted metal-dependent HD superfamily phosphohydrolase